MEFRKKTMATLLIVIFAVSIMAFAVAGQPDYWFTPEGTSQAGVVYGMGLGHDGSNYYAALSIPGSGDIDDNAKLRISYTGTLGTLGTFSYWTKVIGTDGELHPYGTINIDSDHDGNCDYVIVQWEVGSYPPTGADEWIQTVWSGDTRIHVVDATTGVAITGFTQTDAGAGTATLGALKLLDEGVWNTYDVLQVKLAVGMWTVTYPLEGFVDDIQVNELTYDFELDTAVTMSATVDMQFVSIVVDPATVNFGSILEGSSGSSSVNVRNNGNVLADVTAELIDEYPAGFYTNNFKMNNLLVANWGIDDLDLYAINSVDVPLTLEIPMGTPPGTTSAALVFWAEIATP